MSILMIHGKMLTDKPHDNETDSDDEIEGNDHAYEKEKRLSSVPFPTALQKGPNSSTDEIVNIAPGEGPFTSESNWEALEFPKDYSTGKNHFNEYRKFLLLLQSIGMLDCNVMMTDQILNIYSRLD